MEPKTIKILYWVLLILFAAAMFADAMGGITRQEAGKEVMKHLGYPDYLLTITGIAKLIAALAILQNTFTTIKEWAFAGITISFIGAFSSRLAVGDSGFLLILPLIMLAVMFLVYFLWKKYERLHGRL